MALRAAQRNTTTTAKPVRCGCGWPALRTVTVTAADGKVARSGPTCRACLDSIQQDGRYFTASIDIGPVVADPDQLSDWFTEPHPLSLDEHERGLQLYRVASDVAQALHAVPGWHVQRSGVCIGVRFRDGQPRKHGDGHDYWVWVESPIDRHLHAIATASRDARWQALKDYLDDRIAALKAEAEDWVPVAQMTREFEGKTATLTSVRKHMSELEARK